MADYFNYGRAALQTDIHARLVKGDDPSEVLPMVVAHHDGNTGMVTDLLNLGGSVEATGNHSMRLVHLAIISGKPEVLALLIEHGADLTHKDHLGNSYIDWAGAAPMDVAAMSAEEERGAVTSEMDRLERRAAVLDVLIEALKKQGLPTVLTNRFKATRHWPK
jgi:hypothetical protein